MNVRQFQWACLVVVCCFCIFNVQKFIKMRTPFSYLMLFLTLKIFVSRPEFNRKPFSTQLKFVFCMVKNFNNNQDKMLIKYRHNYVLRKEKLKYYQYLRIKLPVLIMSTVINSTQLHRFQHKRGKNYRESVLHSCTAKAINKLNYYF